MASKKKGLAETFVRLKQSEQPEQVSPASTQSEPQPKPNTRTGKKHIGGYFDTNVWAQLKIMSVEKGGMTLQDMLTEAINNYFTVNDKPPIAK